MANSNLVRQSLVEKTMAVKFFAGSGFADRVSFRPDLCPTAQKNQGFATTVRRETFQGGDSLPFNGTVGDSTTYTTSTDATNQYRLPTISDVTSYGATWQPMNDSTVPLVIEKKIEYNIQASLEEMTGWLDREDLQARFLNPAITYIRDQLNYYISSKVEAATGNALVTTASAANILQSLYDADALMCQRKGLVDGAPKSVIFNPKVMPIYGLGPSTTTLFSGIAEDNSMYKKGTYSEIAGFEVYRSPLLTTPTIASAVAGRTLTIASTAAARPTTWAPTWTTLIAGFTVGDVVPAGTKISLTNAGGLINWINPGIKTDAGYKATFSVVTGFTASSTTVQSVTLSEVFIPTGAQQNVSADLVPGTTTVQILSSGIQRPSYAFANDAIVVVSPEVSLPNGLSYAKNLKFGGFNVAMMETVHPVTMQNIVKLITYVGAAVVKPEGITALYHGL